jgi:hypothetical protein
MPLWETESRHGVHHSGRADFFFGGRWRTQKFDRCHDPFAGLGSGGTLRRPGPGLSTGIDSGTNMGNSTSSAGGQSGSSSANQSGGSSSGGLGSRIAGSSGSHRSVHLPISSLSLPFRSGGSLGLSKAELDARCQPSG